MHLRDIATRVDITKRLVTLQRYARARPDAVAALTAAYDPARRR